MVKYFDGDLLKSDCNVICHQVNTLGVMGAGIALQIKNEYSGCFQKYKEICDYFKDEQDKLIGRVLLWEDNILDIPSVSVKLIANFFSQIGLGRNVQTDYKAFRACCKELKGDLKYYFPITVDTFKIGFPYKIGCGLAGGDWNIIKQIIEEEFADDIWNVEIWRFEK